MTSLVKIIKEQNTSCQINQNSHYLFVDGRDKVHQNFNDVCFARFLASKIKKARLFVNQHKRINFKKIHAKYIEWVVKKSPWRTAFLNGKRPQREYFEKGLSINPNLSSQFVVGAMCAVRMGWEYPVLIKNFWKWIEEYQISPELSHILVQIVSEDGFICPQTGGHGTFSYDATVECIKAFKEGKTAYNKPIKDRAGSYMGITSQFTSEGQVKLDEKLQEGGSIIVNAGKWNQSRKIDLKSEKFKQLLKELDND